MVEKYLTFLVNDKKVSENTLLSYKRDINKGLNPDIEVKSFQGVKGVLFETPHMKDAVYVYQKKR